VCVVHYRGIRGLSLALDTVVSGLFVVSSLPPPEAALSRAAKTKFDKHSEGVRSRPDIRVIHFAATFFGGFGGHATAFLRELAMEAAAC
jgi:hypothetical protein